MNSKYIKAIRGRGLMIGVDIDPAAGTAKDLCKKLEPVSKISSAPVNHIRAATSSNFAKKSSVYLSGYTSGFFAHFPRLASRQPRDEAIFETGSK